MEMGFCDMQEMSEKEVTMTKSEIAKLKELAKKATPGPWQFFDREFVGDDRECVYYKHFCNVDQYGAHSILFTDTKFFPDENRIASTMADALFIAHANPAAILNLIGWVELAIEALEMGAFHHTACPYHESIECLCAHEKVDAVLKALDGGSKT